MPGYRARIRLLRGLCSTSAKPRASSKGGRYTPKRPRRPFLSPYQPPTDWTAIGPRPPPCHPGQASARPPRPGASSHRGPAASRGGLRRQRAGNAAGWRRPGTPAREDRPTCPHTSGTQTSPALSSASRGRPVSPSRRKSTWHLRSRWSHPAAHSSRGPRESAAPNMVWRRELRGSAA